MINFIVSVTLWAICVGVVSMAALVGVILFWATKFDEHIRQQTKEREEDD